MKTPPLTILPVLNRTIDLEKDRSHYLRQESIIAEHLELSTSKLTLEVAKRIWATYSNEDLTNKSVETELARNTNALGLNLGVEGDKDMSSVEPLANCDGKTPRSELNTPASEHAVDVLLPTTDVTMETTPTNVPLPSPSSNGIHHSELNGDRYQTSMLDASSSLDESQRISRPDALKDMRGALMDSFQKALHLRYPNLDVDHDKLKDRFAKKLTDAEVQDFLRMGQGVVEDLKRSGKISEAKRKLASHVRDDESEARRNRRRKDRSLSPAPADDSQSTDRMDVSHHVDFSTADGAPRASTSKVIPKGQNDSPSSPSSDPRFGSPSTPIRSRTRKDTSDPPPLGNDSNMSTSTLPQQPLESLHSRDASIPSDSGHHKDVPVLPHNYLQSAPAADEPPHSHDTEDEGTMAIDDELSDSLAPRIILAKQGHSMADVLDASFDINERLYNAIQRWTERWKDHDPSKPHMRLYLTSIPTAAAENALRENPPDSSPCRLAESVAQINVVWPPPGTFYVSLNEERPGTIFWREHFFGPSSPPLDISNFLVSGENTIRFIQLEDHSQWLFLILAMPPSETEKQKKAVWNNQLGEHTIMSSISKVQAISSLSSESA